tara:strand:- start:114 stop:260 length:147 start_codon:yes stop_codon:yes gene_type:complete
MLHDDKTIDEAVTNNKVCIFIGKTLIFLIYAIIQSTAKRLTNRHSGTL